MSILDFYRNTYYILRASGWKTTGMIQLPSGDDSREANSSLYALKPENGEGVTDYRRDIQYFENKPFHRLYNAQRSGAYTVDKDKNIIPTRLNYIYNNVGMDSHPFAYTSASPVNDGTRDGRTLKYISTSAAGGNMNIDIVGTNAHVSFMAQRKDSDYLALAVDYLDGRVAYAVYIDLTDGSYTQTSISNSEILDSLTVVDNADGSYQVSLSLDAELSNGQVDGVFNYMYLYTADAVGSLSTGSLYIHGVTSSNRSIKKSLFNEDTLYYSVDPSGFNPTLPTVGYDIDCYEPYFVIGGDTGKHESIGTTNILGKHYDAAGVSVEAAEGLIYIDGVYESDAYKITASEANEVQQIAFKGKALPSSSIYSYDAGSAFLSVFIKRDTEVRYIGIDDGNLSVRAACPIFDIQERDVYVPNSTYVSNASVEVWNEEWYRLKFRVTDPSRGVTGGITVFMASAYNSSFTDPYSEDGEVTLWNPQYSPFDEFVGNAVVLNNENMSFGDVMFIAPQVSALENSDSWTFTMYADEMGAKNIQFGHGKPFFFKDNELQVFTTPTTLVNTGVAIADGKWAFTYDDDTKQFTAYLNGTMVYEKTIEIDATQKAYPYSHIWGVQGLGYLHLKELTISTYAIDSDTAEEITA